MISSVTNVTQTQPAPQSTPVNPKETQSKPQPTTTDTVQISTTAQAMLQESSETAAQTSQEASRGDMQAQRKLARLAALKE